MRPNKTERKLAQALANHRGAKLKIDGAIGPKSRRALGNILMVSLPGDRLVAGMIQKAASESDAVDEVLELDFWFGPATEWAAEQLQAELEGLPEPTRPHDRPRTSAKCWKPTDRQMMARYGKPGEGFQTFDLPYPLRLDWDLGTVVTRTTLHELCVPSAVRALEAVEKHYSPSERRRLGLDRYGGGANVRKKRGGSTWSTHAFGAATDWFPSMNRLRWDHRRAAFARPDYEDWFKIWADEGWIGLGTCYDFDWMHLQKNP